MKMTKKEKKLIGMIKEMKKLFDMDDENVKSRIVEMLDDVKKNYVDELLHIDGQYITTWAMIWYAMKMH